MAGGLVVEGKASLLKRWISVLIAAASLAALVALPTTAWAHHQDLRDPDDVRGRFDIRRVDHWGRHVGGGWELSTFRKWHPRVVWDAGFFIINVDTFGTSRYDYYVMVRSHGRGMEALLFRDRVEKRDRILRKLAVWRPDAKSVRFRFPWNDVYLPEHRSVYRWNAQSLLTSDACPSVCIDTAPNNQEPVVTRIRPEPAPTPTP
jgi:hypothetical protein